MKPEEALAAARAAAAKQGYEDVGGLRIEPTDRVTIEQLMAWAVIEPDLENVRSTRRGGGPITWLKRRLVHLMRQYHGQILAEQTRFNMHVMVQLAELEERIARLEGERREQ
jgi:hypothetical protein